MERTKATNSKGILYLIGGGDEAYNSWSDLIFSHIVEKSNWGTIAVIYYRETDDWMCNYFRWLGAKDARHVIISNPQIANHPQTYRHIVEADGIFIEGGHQRHYVENLAGTLAKKALIDAYYGGKIISGTSAGAMILSEISFVSKNGRVHPEDLFHNPFLQSISIQDHFLSLLPNTLIDTHFSERSRLPRLITLMARYWKEKKRKIIGIGIDEETVLSIDSDMKASVIGNGTVTFLIPDASTQIRYEFPKPPEITNVKIHQLVAGNRFDFNTNEVIGAIENAPAKTRRNHSLKNPMIFFGARCLEKKNGHFSGAINQFYSFVGGTEEPISMLVLPESKEMAMSFMNAIRNRRPLNIAILSLNDNKQESQLQAPILQKSSCALLIGQNLAELIARLRANTPIAKTFRNRVKAGMSIGFFSDAIKIAGRIAISGMEVRTEIEESGNSRCLDGMNFLKNIILMPNFLDEPPDNPGRIAALFQALKMYPGYLGILVDSKAYGMMVSKGKLRFGGHSSTILINTQQAMNQTYGDNSGVHEHQDALIGATLHCLHDGHEFNLDKHEVVQL